MAWQEREHEHGLPNHQWPRVEAIVEEAHRQLTKEQKTALAHAEADRYHEAGLPV